MAKAASADPHHMSQALEMLFTRLIRLCFAKQSTRTRRSNASIGARDMEVLPEDRGACSVGRRVRAVSGVAAILVAQSGVPEAHRADLRRHMPSKAADAHCLLLLFQR